MADNPSPSDIIRGFLQRGDATGWFEALYAAADGDASKVPWAHMAANPHLMTWLAEHDLRGEGQRALVVGCGLGDDAEELARRGFAVTAFDVSESAINWCKQRFFKGDVQYVVADLFHPPQDWIGVYDFVLESRTIQSLPVSLRDNCMRHIADFIAPGGQLWVMCVGREDDTEATGPPWPISRKELARFEENGLTQTLFESHVRPDDYPQFRAVYQRAAAP